MLDDLQERAQGDMEAAQAVATEQVTELKDRVRESVDQVPGAAMLTDQVAQHPFSSVLIGFGAGIALGIASASLTERRADPAYERRQRQQRRTAARDATRRPRSTEARYFDEGDEDAEDDQREGGLTSGLMDVVTASALGALIKPVQDEAQALLREVVNGFLAKQPERAAGGEAESGVEGTDGGRRARLRRSA